MSFNELKLHGTVDFPMQLYCLNKQHPKYNMAHHWHTNFELVYVKEGAFYLSIDNKEYILKKGDVAFINSESVHGGHPKDADTIYECIVFNPDDFSSGSADLKDFLEKLFNHELYVNEFFDGKSSVSFYAKKLFENMSYEKNSASRILCIGSIFALFGEILNKGEFSGQRNGAGNIFKRNEPKLKKVLVYIRSNYDRHITLAEMAKECEMSPKYFCSYFKKMTKMTPTQYLLFYRAEKSAKQLLQTENSITTIAYACGFSDLSYYIKVFKERFGISPGQFRKQRNS